MARVLKGSKKSLKDVPTVWDQASIILGEHAVKVGTVLFISVALVIHAYHNYDDPFERLKFICLSGGLCIALVMTFFPRVPQDQSYHRFADERPLHIPLCGCGKGTIPNAWNVLTNLCFAFTGLLGIDQALNGKESLLQLNATIVNSAERMAWVAYFLGIALTSLGSAYYHWRPNNVRLVWDRLPMTVAFAGINVVIAEERLGLGELLLVPALVVACGSTWYWALYDDLRPYALVQFLPFLFLPAMMSLFAPVYTHQYDIVYALIFYTLAKICEALDFQIYEATGHIVSGHALKHIFGAMTPATSMYSLHRRSTL